MAQENEDDEIEQHLLDKISHAIDHQGDQQNLVTKFFSFESEFRVLMNILQSKTNPNPSVIQDWSSLRTENLYYLNNLLNEWQMTKKQTSFSPKEVYESCENIKKSLKKMKKELNGEESSSRGDHDKSVSHHQEPNHQNFERNKNQVYRWSSRHGPREVHGFEHAIMEMERELVMVNIDDSFKVFGVVGVAGIGKTALCQAIFGRKLVREHFSPRIWVCLSKQPRDKEDYKEEIIVRVLKCLGIEDDVISNGNGLRRLILLLRLQLIGKRYLIVLDDAWNDDKFFMNLTQNDENLDEELAYALPKGYGGTVISSSRRGALLKQMLGKDVCLQNLKPHADEIIDKIFKDTVTGYDEDEREFPEHLEELKREILKKCDGIPLAAQLLGKIARDQLPVKPKPPIPTSAGGGFQKKAVPADGVGQSGGGGGGIQGDEHKGGSLPKLKHKNVLPPIGSDQMA